MTKQNNEFFGGAVKTPSVTFGDSSKFARQTLKNSSNSSPSRGSHTEPLSFADNLSITGVFIIFTVIRAVGDLPFISSNPDLPRRRTYRCVRWRFLQAYLLWFRLLYNPCRVLSRIFCRWTGHRCCRSIAPWMHRRLPPGLFCLGFCRRCCCGRCSPWCSESFCRYG